MLILRFKCYFFKINKARNFLLLKYRATIIIL